MTLKIINLETGMPTVEEARQRLAEEIRQAQASGIIGMKLIHGYGSTGVGGRLRDGIRKSLLLRKKEGIIAEIVFGERWDIFDKISQQILQTLPALKRDIDLQKFNPGITIVLMKPWTTER